MRRPAWRRAVYVGSAGAGAYLLAQALDRQLAPNGYDDLVLWGGFVTPVPRRQRAIGLLIHTIVGIALAAAYDALLPILPRMPGPLRGLLFTQAENALLYPGVPLLNAVHPAVRRGELPALVTLHYFWVEVWRHAAFGVVLGALSRERTGEYRGE